VIIDRIGMTGHVDFIGEEGRTFDPGEGSRILAARSPRPDLAPHAALPEDTRLWAELQRVSGGTWSGCVYDVEKIVAALRK
jgi:hypothetical protein